VNLLYHPAYQTYNFGPHHPFSPLRQQMLSGLLAQLGYPVSPYPLQPVEPDQLLSVHAERYVRRVEAASLGRRVVDLEQYGLGQGDTPSFTGMGLAARWLVAGTLEAARLVAGGERQAIQLGGGLHHGQYDRASGFCIYNDLSVAINYLVGQGLRVAYIDIDVHHGDGVQWLHYADPRVLTLSLHLSGRFLFPGSGHTYEIGRGEGVGTKLNLPLEPYTEGDSYLESLAAVAEPALAWFRPDVLLIQSGADAHHSDPLAELRLTTHNFQRLFELLDQYAVAFAGGRAVHTLGGGYNLDAAVRIWTLRVLQLLGQPLPTSLPTAWLAHWQGQLDYPLTPTLHDTQPILEAVPRQAEIAQHNRKTVVQLLEAVQRYWT
jgi:acetoin utilization protein AcuC